jgi:SAM-dependent methyltransferase
VYLTKRLTDQAATRYYERYNAGRDEDDPALLEQRRKMYELDRRFVHHFARPGKLLDYGCGTGEFMAGLDPTLVPSGFDVDPDAIRRARDRWPALEFDTELDTIAARSGPFDTVTLRGTLQYVRDLAKFVRDVERVLAPRGRVILLATPNADAPLAELLRERWVLHNRVEHLVIFSLTSLARLFETFDMVHFDFPYIGTPYERRHEDLERFVALCRGDESRTRFPFWGSMMNVVLEHVGTGDHA